MSVRLDPVFLLEGVVLSVRCVDIEARPATDEYPAREASRYYEADVLTDGGSLRGEYMADVQAICTVVLGDEPTLAQGEKVSGHVRAYPTWKNYRGRSFNVQAYRWLGSVRRPVGV